MADVRIHAQAVDVPSTGAPIMLHGKPSDVMFDTQHAYIVMACIAMAYTGMTCIVMAHMIMAYIAMGYIVMGYIVMGYIVMAGVRPTKWPILLWPV